MTRATTAVGAAALLYACSGAYGDAGGPGDAGAPLDATTDALANDAGMVADTSAPDAVPGTTPDASFSCKSLTPAPLFCDDFDDKATAGEGWSFVDTAGYTIALDTAAAVSSPQSILLSAVSDAGTGSYKQQLKKDFGAVYTDVTIEFDARVDAGHYRSYPFNQYGTVQGHTIGYSLWLDLQDGSSTLVENAYDFTASSTIVNKQFSFVAAVPKDKFRHYTLSVKLGNTSTATLKVDGAAVVDNVALDPKWVALDLYVDFGLSYQTLPSDNVVHLDDVVVYAK